MIIWGHRIEAAIVFVAATFFTAACDSGAPSRTADEFAADSALAADLALANRDTLLVDSIGAYREADAAERDTAGDIAISVPDAASPQVAASPPLAAKKVETPVAPPPAPKVAADPKPTAGPTAPKKAAAPAPRLTGTRACTSPTQENQSECIRVSIAAADARLNRIYRALITEMRRKEGVPAGGKDPASVQRLRVAQRQWLVYRDNECRRLGRGKEGALWARPRARCLGQFSARRANELADDFVKLTAN
jgi:uncharacterized protein YecT (DUF1311 family)